MACIVELLAAVSCLAVAALLRLSSSSSCCSTRPACTRLSHWCQTESSCRYPARLLLLLQLLPPLLPLTLLSAAR